MAIEKSINVGGQVIKMRASALIPRMYRAKFGRDLIRDMKSLQDDFNKVKGDAEASLSVMDLTIFENMAWLMAKHADPDVADTPDEWLDGIDGVLSIYEVLPDILTLWSDNLRTTSSPRKK